MKCLSKSIFIFLSLVFSAYLLPAQTNFLEPVANRDLPQPKAVVRTIKKMGIVRLDEGVLRNYLLAGPLEFQNGGAAIPLAIPLPVQPLSQIQVGCPPMTLKPCSAGYFKSSWLLVPKERRKNKSQDLFLSNQPPQGFGTFKMRSYLFPVPKGLPVMAARVPHKSTA